MLVVGDAGSTYPEVVAKDFGIDGKVVIRLVVPVGPVQRSVCGAQRFVQFRIVYVIFLKRFTVWFLYVQKVVAAGYEQE